MRVAMAMAPPHICMPQVPSPPSPVRQLSFHKVEFEEEPCLGGGSGMHYLKLDSALWSNLPGVLLELVLLRLPAASQARFRAVCRGWCSLLSSPDFLNRSIPSSCLLFVLEEHHQPAPSPPTPALVVSAASIPEQFRRWHLWSVRVRTHCGLVCLVSHQGWEERKLCVYLMNPLNQTWRQLPELEWQQKLPRPIVVQLMVVPDKKSAGFKVVVVTQSALDIPTSLSVYSSTTSCWSFTFRELAGLSAFRVRYKRYVVCDGVLYALVGSESPKMALFDIEDGIELGWLPRLPSVYSAHPYFVHLGEFQGRVVWVERDQVGGVALRDFACRIWMLDAGREQWELIAVTPDEVLTPMRKVQLTANETCLMYAFNMKVAGSTILINMGLALAGHTHVVAYNIVKRRWRVIVHDCWCVRNFHIVEPRPTLYLN